MTEPSSWRRPGALRSAWHHCGRVHREALAALLTLQRAAAVEAATVSLVREVAAVLERARQEG